MDNTDDSQARERLTAVHSDSLDDSTKVGDPSHEINRLENEADKMNGSVVISQYTSSNQPNIVEYSSRVSIVYIFGVQFIYFTTKITYWFSSTSVTFSKVKIDYL